MTEPTIEPMQELRIWVRESDYRALQSKAKAASVSEAEMAVEVLTQALDPHTGNQDMTTVIETALNRYFAELLSRILAQLPVPEHQQESGDDYFRL